MPPPPIDEELREYQTALAETVESSTAAEVDLQAVFKETSVRIQAKLRVDADNMNAVQLEQHIGQEFEHTVHKRRRIIAGVIEKGATTGRRASHKTLRAVFGEQTMDSQVRATKRAMAHAGDRIAGRVVVDHVPLSKRIRAHDKELIGELAREVQKGIRTRKGIEQIAKKIQKLDTTVESDLPKYLQEVEQLARQGNVKEMKALAKRYAARARKTLGALADGTRKASPYSLRAPTEKFLRDVQKVGAEGIDGVVKRYVEEKAAWRAKVIARTESVEAFRRSTIEQSKGKAGVYAFEWRVSFGPKRLPDECDVYANQNAHGLGRGRYPADHVPRSHTNCRCAIVPCVDRKHFDRPANDSGEVPEDLRDRTSPNAAGWLKQNDAMAAKILGPTRHQLFKQGANVLDSSGKPLLVGVLLPTSSRHAAE